LKWFYSLNDPILANIDLKYSSHKDACATFMILVCFIKLKSEKPQYLFIKLHNESITR